jgi:hypothetical protein
MGSSSLNLPRSVDRRPSAAMAAAACWSPALLLTTTWSERTVTSVTAQLGTSSTPASRQASNRIVSRSLRWMTT